MALLIPAPDWGYCSHNIGNPTGINFGSGVTAGANNADGSAASVMSALSHDVELLVIGLSGFGLAAGAINPCTLLDILIDPAGGTSWASLIDDLLVGGTYPVNLQSSTVGIGTPLWFSFPVWIPAGATIGGMARTAHSSTITGRVVIYAYGGNRNPGSWWCGRKVTSIGINASSSRGTDHTPAASSSFSSWASLGSATTTDAYAYQWAAQGENDTDWQSTTPASASPYNFEFGVDSTRIGPPLVKGITAGEVGASFPTSVGYRHIPAGSQLQVRGAAFGVSPQTIDVAAYLVS
jgi:hypothetical protein